MKLAAANALAQMVDEDKLNEEYIIPGAFEENVADKVAQAVMDYVK